MVPAMRSTPSFSIRIAHWQRQHGRHGLPWQGTRDPYRVWLSEVMLQQTQVATVLDYYPRFLQRFPDVATLAAAPEGDVMALWSGLGYYRRARHLHQCARQVVERLGGQFPRSAARLEDLPGIGPSTAAAIAAFCFGERAAIFDGNVQRVLARWLGDAGDLASAAHVKTLRERAQTLLPPSSADMPAYTQGLMDLGALICTPRQPRCSHCPLAEDCAARRQGCPERYPVKTRKPRRAAQTLWLLLASAPDAPPASSPAAIWLEQRPAQGIWAGLHALPAFDSCPALLAALPADARASITWLPPVTHALTHKTLTLHTARARLPATQALPIPGQWRADWPTLGLPAPMRRLMQGERADA